MLGCPGQESCRMQALEIAGLWGANALGPGVCRA